MEEFQGIPAAVGRLLLEATVGIVEAIYTTEGDRITSVEIINVPSFLAARNFEVECPDLVRLKVDVAYGGNFYAIVPPQENYTDLADYSSGAMEPCSAPAAQRAAPVRASGGQLHRRAKPHPVDGPPSKW